MSTKPTHVTLVIGCGENMELELSSGLVTSALGWLSGVLATHDTDGVIDVVFTAGNALKGSPVNVGNPLHLATEVKDIPVKLGDGNLLLPGLELAVQKQDAGHRHIVIILGDFDITDDTEARLFMEQHQDTLFVGMRVSSARDGGKQMNALFNGLENGGAIHLTDHRGRAQSGMNWLFEQLVGNTTNI